MPNFFAPFTRRMPAASSGLKSPISAASYASRRTAANLTLTVPDWVKETLDDWLSTANIRQGRLFRCVCRKGRVWGTKVTEKVVWHVVKEYAERLGISKLAPHDLRRSCARFCHDSGGELEQIQFLLGHVSVQTTEKYLGCKQRLREAVNDRIGIEPA